jgi:hypothetical protein
MKKLIVSAVLTVSDDCNPGMVGNILSAIAEPMEEGDLITRNSTVGIQTVNFRPLPGGRTVWIYESPEEDAPFYLVDNAGSTSESRPLTEDENDRLMQTGVCTSMHSRHPRSGRVGVPGWAFGQHPYSIPSMNGFFVSEGFNASSEDSGDDTPESFWHLVALPSGSDFLKA